VAKLIVKAKEGRKRKKVPGKNSNREVIQYFKNVLTNAPFYIIISR
jgi:hypothetical protein